MLQLYDAPIELFGLIIVGSFVIVSVGGLWLFQRYAIARFRLTEEMNNDIIFFASAISVFYSLTVGLIAVGAWTTYTQVQDVVSNEAATVATLYRTASGYPEPTRTRLRDGLQAYLELVINQSWPAQARGVILDDGTLLLNSFQTELMAFEPTTAGQQIFHAELLRQFNQLVLLRRLRIDSIGGGLPWVMWWIVLFGAVMTIGVTYLLKIQPTVHTVLTAILALFVGLVVFVIASLDQPLSGPLMISPEPYQLVLDRIINFGR